MEFLSTGKRTRVGLTKRSAGAMMSKTIEKLLRGRGFVREPLLNKIIGCESRTVPPLYVPMVGSRRKSVTGKLGRQSHRGNFRKHKSEDLRK